jgi:hypothetical protein
LRGEEEIRAASELAQMAADRNSHKVHWNDHSTGWLVDKVEEEWDELLGAMEDGGKHRQRDEFGDLWWTLTMLADRVGLFDFEHVNVDFDEGYEKGYQEGVLSERLRLTGTEEDNQWG